MQSNLLTHRWPAHLACLLALAICAGCSSVRRAREVQNPDSLLPGERTSRLAELALSNQTALTIEDAVRLAISNNPDVFQARATLSVAECQLQETRANYLPQVDSSAGYDRSKQFHPATEAADNYRPAVSFSQNLLSFGRQEAALRQARAAREAAAAGVQSAINTAAYNARIAFIDLLRAQDLLTIANENVRDYAAHLEQVRVMASLGTRIRYDITKAEVDLGNARLAALNASNTLLTTRAALGRALGLTEEFPCPLAAAPVSLPPVEEDRDALHRLARQHNPNLAVLLSQAAAASAAVDFAVADLRPDLSLSAGFSWSGGALPLSRGWQLGPSLDWSLFNGWRKTSALEAATAELQAARSHMASREQQLFQDLITALIQLHTAREQALVAEVVVQSARESLNLTDARYRVGLATAVERTDAESAVAQARTQQVQARHDELAAQALILLNTGA